MIGDFPIQFSIYTNCLLHHAFLACEACGVAYNSNHMKYIEIHTHHIVGLQARALFP